MGNPIVIIDSVNAMSTAVNKLSYLTIARLKIHEKSVQWSSHRVIVFCFFFHWTLYFGYTYIIVWDVAKWSIISAGAAVTGKMRKIFFHFLSKCPALCHVKRNEPGFKVGYLKFKSLHQVVQTVRNVRANRIVYNGEKLSFYDPINFPVGGV